MEWPWTYAPSRVQVNESSGVAEYFQNAGNRPVNLTLPSRVAIRGTTATFADAEFDVGWLDFGLGLRVGPLAEAQRVPWGVHVGWRRPSHLLDSADYDGDLWRVRVEAYPHLTTARRLELFGVAALGVSSGPFPFYSRVPSEDPDNAGWFHAAEWAAHQTRLEGSFGVHGHVDAGRFTAVLMPYVTLEERGHQVRTELGIDQRGASNDWGFSVVFSPSVGYERARGSEVSATARPSD
jgi:hypothetical protein